MKLKVKNTIKDAIIVSLGNNEVTQTPTRLNAGMLIRVHYVQELDGGLLNAHLQDGSTLINISRKDVEFCAIQNDLAIKEIRSPSDPDPAPPAGPDGKKQIKRSRKSCCGGS